MNYRITVGETVVLARTRVLQAVLIILFALLGGPALAVGVVLFAAGGDPYGPCFFTGFGVLFLCGAYMLGAKVRIPDAIIFDNAAGTMTVREGRVPGRGESVVPYDEIAGFSRMGASGCPVVMAKKDGALWTLFSSSKKSNAEAFLKTLADNVRLDARCAGADAGGGRGGSRFSVEEGRGVTAISWKDRHPLRSSLLSLLIIGSMGLTLFGAWPRVTGIVAYGAAVLFILVVMVLALYNTVYSIGKTRRVTVTAGDLRYEETGGPVRGKSFSVPLAAIGAVLFNFSIHREDSALYVARKEERESFGKISRGEISPADIFEALSLMLRMKRINAIDLSTVEKMELERLIQKAIAERGGIAGI